MCNEWVFNDDGTCMCNGCKAVLEISPFGAKTIYEGEDPEGHQEKINMDVELAFQTEVSEAPFWWPEDWN